MKKIIILSVFCILLICQAGQAAFLDDLRNALEDRVVPQAGSGKVDMGLKEALNVGTKKAINHLGKNNGYFANQAVKILLPEEVRQVESVLRSVGYGPQLDEFTLSMNRAAEKAAPLAANIFSDAITEMSFEDANKILRGCNTAATDYLKEKTYGKLLELFQPSVRKTMNQYTVTKQYEAITGKVQSLPLVGNVIDLDINQYVCGKALDGLFYAIAEEETAIRTNPKARVTRLLKEVFN